MPIPPITEVGWLPAGEHDCTIGELRERFAHERSSRRQEIFGYLEAYLSDPRVLEQLDHVLVDGSFVSEKVDPGDIDMVAGLRPGWVGRLLSFTVSDRMDTLYRVAGQWLGPPGTRPLHIFPFEVGSRAYTEMRRFFQKSDREDEPDVKGIVKITLPRSTG